MSEDLFCRLEEALGHVFRDRTLLTHALTHSSRRPEVSYSNERLEFLGDAILGCAISELLYRRFPEHAEGILTRIKSVVVSRASLVRTARQLGIEQHLIVAKGVAQPNGVEGGHTLPTSLIANAFEAIVAAVYLDSDWPTANAFVLRHMEEQVERACRTALTANYKSALQEYAQRKLGVTPVYRISSETGPDHGKSFEVVTLIGAESYGVGHGSTKKAAEQEAAATTLSMLQEKQAEEPATEAISEEQSQTEPLPVESQENAPAE